VFHADGTLAEPPIALCEVQGYVYGAWRAAAQIAAALGRTDEARGHRERADRLRERFEAAFWCEELGTYALALDGHKRPCQVRTSNAGQCLATGIVAPERARRVAGGLFDERFFSGWGVRTLAAEAPRYNPMSYHNGSIWPHDNALIAAGLAAYGLNDLAVRITTALFEASQSVELHRLPELFCGFARRGGEGPTLYPVACAPQAWSAATVFLLLQACLGLHVSAVDRCVSFLHPHLPACLDRVHLHDLVVGDAVVDLLLSRHGADVGINVLKRSGPVEIRMVK
jgi:glycogen debranching enzyme